jgi:hypothetical protein
MKFKLDALVHLHLRGNSDKKKKKKKVLQTCSKDLDNLTYGLFKKPGRYNSDPIRLTRAHRKARNQPLEVKALSILLKASITKTKKNGKSRSP